MRASRNLQFYTTTILLIFTSFTAAWPWPRWLPELDSLVVRQNDDKSSSSPKASQTPSPSPDDKDSASPSVFLTTFNGVVFTSTAADRAPTGSSASGTGKQTGSITGSRGTSKTGTATKKSQSTAFDARLPAGGVAMITPAIIEGPQYYKVGDFVTFAWNYTSLLATPTAINIMATCTANQQLYTIAANQTVSNATGAVTWDTGAYQQTALSDPLLTEKYTLLIYDAESSVSATAQAGYLAVYNQYTFGMYTPQAYTPLGEFKCATCSGALSDMERRALGMVVGMSVITVLSFTWFVGGLGVIW